MSEVISIVSTNPSIAGFALFIIVFLPLLAYVIRWAERSTDNLKKTYEKVLDKADDREARLSSTINGTLAEQTRVLSNMNTSLTLIHENMSDLSNRVEDIEKIVESKGE